MVYSRILNDFYRFWMVFGTFWRCFTVFDCFGVNRNCFLLFFVFLMSFNVSSSIFDDFWRIFDGQCCFIDVSFMGFDGFSRFLTYFRSFGKFLMNFCQFSYGFRRFSIVFDGFHWFLDFFLLFMIVFDWFLTFFDGFWWFLTYFRRFFDGFRWFFI